MSVFVLDYLNLSLFADDEELDQNNSYRGIRHPSIFKYVATFLAQLAFAEIEHGEKPEFTIWRNRATQFKEQFADELKWYARGQYPFNERLNDTQPHAVRRWWRRLVGNRDTLILPVSDLSYKLIC